MVAFTKWPSLNSFHEVAKSCSYNANRNFLAQNDYTLAYVAKIKMHGTNASVYVNKNKTINAGARNRMVTVDADNYDFAAWVDKHKDYFETLSLPNRDIIIYGEYCGPGVQNGVAVSETKNRFFYVFAVDLYQTTEIIGKNEHIRVYDPDLILELLPDLPDDIIILPWHCKTIINFIKPQETQETLDRINAEVENIGACDPFMKENFEIEGPGEGLVFYPIIGDDFGIYNAANNDINFFNIFNFKAKAEAHRVNKTQNAAQMDPEQLASVQGFADTFATENRFLQGFTEHLEGQKDFKLIGKFVLWVCDDVEKESITEREKLGVDWKKLSKAIAARAAEWYKAKCLELE